MLCEQCHTLMIERPVTREMEDNHNEQANRSGVSAMRPDRVSAGDCIVLEKIGGIVQTPVTL
jgi:hypothetical protein